MSQFQPNTNSITLQEFLDKSIQIEDKNLFQMLLTQIEKDLNMCGLDWKGESPTLPNQLLLSLDSTVSSLLKGQHNNDIRTFLYRVDVNERHLHQIEVLTIDAIVNLVLRREIEKVWMKYQYSAS